jgi:hypothetical protein
MDLLDRLTLGAECEARFQALWRKASEALCDNDKSRRELDELRRRADQVPLGERADWLQSQAGQDHRDDVEFAIRERRKTPAFAEAVSAYYEYTAPRPKGVAQGICIEVAAEQNRGDVGPRYVRRCWDEFRSFRKASAK